MVSSDLSGRNGVFTETLLKYLHQPLELSAMAKKVAREVREKTGDKQKPEQRSALTDDVYLVAPLTGGGELGAEPAMGGGAPGGS